MIEGLSDTEIEHRLRAAADERWEDLWDALDALALEPEKGQWAGGETVEAIVVEGVVKPVVQMPYVIYSAAVFDVIAKVGGLGASQPFDWQGWDGLNRYPNGRGLNEAPVGESIRMITAIIRADRFGEGTLLANLEDGTFMAAVGGSAVGTRSSRPAPAMARRGEDHRCRRQAVGVFRKDGPLIVRDRHHTSAR